MIKTVPCVVANTSGFVMGAAVIILPSNHANFTRACRAYEAANDLGIRPAIQLCVTMAALIDAMEELHAPL